MSRNKLAKRTFVMSNGQMGVIAEDKATALRVLLEENPAYQGMEIGFQLLDNPKDFSPRDRDMLSAVWPRIKLIIENRCFYTVASAINPEGGDND